MGADDSAGKDRRDKRRVNEGFSCKAMAEDEDSSSKQLQKSLGEGYIQEVNVNHAI